MIRPINIKLNAAHPELPLVEATTFTSAPSSVFIRGVPPNVGNWSITAVNVAVTYPDNTTTARAAVESAEGVWVATIPGTATSGRTTAGFRILADGIDENGASVTGYVLGFADFAVLSFAPVPAPGGTFWLLRYFDAMPTTPKKGDVAVVSGVLKYYNGTTWLPFADLTNYYTKSETDDAIDALAAYYITYNAAGAAFPTRADLLNATTYYSGGDVRVPTRNDYAVVLADETHGGAEWRYIYNIPDGSTTGQWEAQYPIETNDYIALSNKPQINGHTLTGESSQSGDSLGLVDKTGDQAIDGMKSFSSIKVLREFGLTRIYFEDANGNDCWLAFPVTTGTAATIGGEIAPVFSDNDSYVVGQLVWNNDENGDERLYICTSAHTGAWNSSDFQIATVEQALAALRTAIAGKANASDLRYAISESTPLTVTSGAAATTLADRTHNVRTVAAPGTGNTTTITATLPPIVQGKSRDMFLNLTVGSSASDEGDISLSIVEPSGATVQIDIGSVEDIGIGKNEILISENALPTTSGNTTTTHWLVTVRHEDFT